MESGNSTRFTLLILGGGLLMGLALGAVVFFGLPTFSAPPDTTTVSSTPAPITGAPAPDFTLTNLSGTKIRLGDLKGQPVILNYWATWCVPCKDEMPAIEAAYQEHKDKGLTVLAVNADEGLTEVTGFVQSLKLNFEVLMDPGLTVNEAYRVRAYPTSFFVGRDGSIIAMQIGVMNEAQLAENLDKILGEVISVTLYTKPGCDLCREAHDELDALAGEFPHTVTEVSILDDASLFARYQNIIPVVVVGSAQLTYPFSSNDLRDALKSNL